MNYSSRIAGFNRKKKILGFVMSQSIARGLLPGYVHYSMIRRWFASCVARTRTWVGAVTQDIPYTTRKKIYLQRSYVFIEHFMAFNINATRKLHKIAHHHNTWLNSPHQPSLAKNAPPFCLRSLGQDSNACSLLWIKHATSRDVVANR